jgi:hypothetical protein
VHERPGRKNCSEGLGAYERRILEWVFRKYDAVWTGFIWLRIETTGYCENASKT